MSSFPFHQVAHTVYLSLKVDKYCYLDKKHGERFHTMGGRQFSIRDKQISFASWKLGAWLVC